MPNDEHSGERDILRGIRARAGRQAGNGVRVGIGDDCAVLTPRAGEEMVVTTDFSLEGRHFRLDWHEPEAIGHKCLARGLSDIAAMGARPLAAFVSLGLPQTLTRPSPGTAEKRGAVVSRLKRGSMGAQKTSGSWLDGFYTGLLALADREGVTLAGGDLSESPTLAVADIVVIGAAPRGRALLRSTARAGDILYVTGTLGGAAAALAALEALHAADSSKGSSALPTQALPGWGTRTGVADATLPAHARAEASIPGDRFRPHFYPQPRLATGQLLLRNKLASACIDISDGLSVDLMHLCEESDLAGELNADALPMGTGASLLQALHGGDDYELLFTAPPRTAMPKRLGGIAIHPIGRMLRRGPGIPRIALVTQAGRRTRRAPLRPQGWEHF